MLQGSAVRLHVGTVCYLIPDSEPGIGKDSSRSSAHVDERCTIISFDDEATMWRVRLEEAEDEILASEAALRIIYCLLPSALNENEIYCMLSFEHAQGDCGRGLVITQAIRKGAPIFQEPPFIVVSSSGDRSHAGTSKERHAERWHALRELEEKARRERECGSGEEQWTTALEAFEELGFAKDVPSHVRDGADHICSTHALAAGHPPHQRVVEVLMRFNCNQFGLSNGAHRPSGEGSGGPFCASALYAFMSRVNHSCNPSLAMASKEAHSKAHGWPFDAAKEAGVIVAYAVRDLAKGERLTFNYAQSSMPAAGDEQWGVQRRRTFLMETLGFLCGCELCVREAAAEEAGRGEARRHRQRSIDASMDDMPMRLQP